MASSSFQISALLLAALGIIILLIATVSNSWKTSSSTNTVNTASQIYTGLWMNCETSVQCKNFYFFLSLDSLPAAFLEINMEIKTVDKTAS